MSKDIWVIAERRNDEIHSSTYELLGKAREIAKKAGDFMVWVIVLSERTMTETEKGLLYRYGADGIIAAVHEVFQRFNFLAYLETLEKLAKEAEPEIILAPATTTGRTIMPALAGVLGTGLTADCTGLDIEVETGNLLQTRPAIGGNIMAMIKTPAHRPQMATVRPKTFSVLEEKYDGPREYREIHPSFFSKIDRMELVEFKGTPSEMKSIQDSEIVISGGRGLRKPENLELLKRIAKLVNGSVGASRPIVDSKWIGHECQVGLSGHTVKPRVYLAAGISGAVQHIAGMQTSDVIVAINKDRNAPIFDFSDIGLVGDASEILETILKRLEALKGEKVR